MRQRPHHQSGAERAGRLAVIGERAVVADVRGGHHNHLPGVGGVGEDLLVARGRRVEHGFPDGDPAGPDRHAAEDLPVGGDEQARFGHAGRPVSSRATMWFTPRPPPSPPGLGTIRTTAHVHMWVDYWVS